MSGARCTIAVLAHAGDGFWEEPRLVHLMMAQWKKMGMKIELVTDPDDVILANLALLHVSLSVVPEAYRRLAGRYPRTLNGATVDIRKRRFSRLLVDREDPHIGPLIVKTDWNAGGWREIRGSAWSRTGIEAALPWRMRRFIPPEEYPVYESADLVPRGVWSNPNLVVERFVAERQGSRYLCRHWLFLGSREVCRRTVSPDPVVKFRGVMERTSDPVPEDLRRIRDELGFDYGKFDYGIVDGEVVLYDVNRTPGAVADPRVHADTIETLAPGIRDFLA